MNVQKWMSEVFEKNDIYCWMSRSECQKYLRKLDIYCWMSRSECQKVLSTLVFNTTSDLFAFIFQVCYLYIFFKQEWQNLMLFKSSIIIRQIQMCTKTCNRYMTLFTTFGGVTLNQQITEKNSTKLIKIHKTAAIN